MRSLVVGLLLIAGCARIDEAAVQDQAIIGGTDDPGHPYVVAVGGRSGAYCTGTVISKRTVLTAGHCVSRGIRKVFLGARLTDDAP